MIHHDSLDFGSVGRLKHLLPADQAAALRAASNDLLQTAQPIRAALETLRGAIVIVIIQGSDLEVVLLALLAMLAHDIATLPDFQMRAEAMTLHYDVIRQLDLGQQDAAFFRQNIELLERALEKKSGAFS